MQFIPSSLTIINVIFVVGCQFKKKKKNLNCLKSDGIFSKQCLLECVNDNILINLDKKGTLTFSIEPSLHSSKEWVMNVKIIGSQELEPLNGSIGQTNVHVHATRI